MRIRTMAFVGISALALLAAAASPATAVPTRAARPAGTAAGTGSSPSPNAPHSRSVVPGITGAAVNDHVSPAARAGFTRSRQQPATSSTNATALTPATTGHAAWGTHQDFWNIGGQATQIVDLNLHLPASDPDTIYAPTFIPAAISCIEMATYYVNSGSYVLAFDWCANNGNGSFAKLTPLSSLGAYITQVNDGAGTYPAYTVQDVQTDPGTNSWTAYLYNYQTHTFDPFWTSASTDKYSQSGSRWDWFETYWTLNPNTGQAYYCTDSVGSHFGTYALSYETYQGHWEAPTASNSHVDPTPSADAMGCNGLRYQMLTPNSNWLVTNG